MRCIVAAAAFLAAAPGLLGQGSVYFSNFSPGNGVLAPVTNGVTRQLAAAGGFWAQLFYGPAGLASESFLTSVTNGAAAFEVPGYFLGGIRYTDPAVLGAGQTGTFQVRAWSAALGATWDEAYANWRNQAPAEDRLLGKSSLFELKVADPNEPPPNNTIALRGLQGFTVDVVPEPALMLLLGIGAGVCLSRGRKAGSGEVR